LKTILLYNPISGTGHFDSWCALFARLLAKKGWRVVIVTPEAGVIRKLLSASAQADVEKIQILDRERKISKRLWLDLPWFEDLIGRLLAFLRAAGQVPSYPDAVSKNQALSKLDIQSAISFTKRVARFIARKGAHTLEYFVTPRLRIDPTNPVVFGRDLVFAQRLIRQNIDVVLNMYVDCYRDELGLWIKFSQLWPKGCCAIHIDINNTLLKRHYMGNKKVDTVLYINEDFASPHEVTINPTISQEAERFIWIPDVATEVLPEKRSTLIDEVFERARSRSIVFLGGAIGGTKNLSTWYKTLELASAEKWFFLQVGAIDKTTLSSEDLYELARVEARNPENLLILDRHIEAEAEFNAFVTCCDIVWGIYRNFDRSSNILGKAAVFEKPIVVSDKYLLGQRVRQAEIGIATDEDNPSEILKAMTQLIEQPVPTICYGAYTTKYGSESLAAILDRTFSERTQSRTSSI
jgi:hypothetical protein